MNSTKRSTLDTKAQFISTSAQHMLLLLTLNILSSCTFFGAKDTQCYRIKYNDCGPNYYDVLGAEDGRGALCCPLK